MKKALIKVPHTCIQQKQLVILLDPKNILFLLMSFLFPLLLFPLHSNGQVRAKM